MENNFVFTYRSNNYPSFTNACVGNNGAPDISHYAKGFAKAANDLIDVALIKGEDSLSYVDFVIYPICFNMRHSIELYLKSYVQFIQEFSEIKCNKIEQSRLTQILTAHDINNIWNYLLLHYKEIDKRLFNSIQIIEPYIESFSYIDSTGQTFRYPFDNNNKKHLIELSIINIIDLKGKFKILENLLHDFYLLNKNLIDEYEQGSFTKNLSRCELFEISEELPYIDEWNKSSFISIKNDIKLKYNISGRELSTAIDIIKNHYEMGFFIGIVPDLIDFKKDEFLFFIDKWSQVNSLTYIHNYDEELDLSYTPLNPSEVINQTTDETESINTITKVLYEKISLATISNIHTLYYIDNFIYSEEYKKSYIQHKKNCERDIKRSIWHMLNKSYLLTKIVINLQYLHQTDIAEILIEKYNLRKYLNQIRKT